jgi:hypothetical protein
MARTRGSRTPRNWAEHQDRHRAGCEPAPAILSSGQSVRQRSKIAFGISSHVTVALLPSCKEAGFEAPPIPLAIQSHWMNSSTADERAGPSGVAPMSVGGTRAKLNGGQSQFAFAPVVQTSTCSAMARASSTSMPRYRTVLSILVCPNSNCTARKLPVRRYMSVALVRRRECVPKKCGSRSIVATQLETSRAYCRVVMQRL